MRRSISALALTVLVSASALAPRPARAQDNAAAVEALFVAGKKLMSEGKIAEACPKFLASYNLEHRLGTLLNLADCYERNGQLASAWGRFVEATTIAQRGGQADRATFAADHARSLEAKLSTLLIAAQATPDLVVTRDGVTVDPGAYGVAVAVDGGTHHVEATAPGKKSWAADVAVKPTLDRATLTVPPLEASPVAALPVASEPAASSGSSSRRAIGLATAGVGVAGVIVGAIFGAAAIGKNHDSAPDCGLRGVADDCNSTGVGLRSTAFTDGTLSTVFIGVGAAAIVGGGVLWLTARSSGTTTVGFDGRTLQLAGSF